MQRALTVVFVFMFLFCVLQVNSSAELKAFKAKRLTYLLDLEEAPTMRHIDTYYCTDDQEFWIPEINYFRSMFTSPIPGLPATTLNYQPRYVGTSTVNTFITHNDDYVDSADLLYFVGHGGNYGIRSGINLKNVPGYGDKDMEFLILLSCSVVPSPDDVADWASPWWEHDGKGIFQGLHSLCGLRNTGWAGDCYTSGLLAEKLRWGMPVIQSWFLTTQEVRNIRGAAGSPSLACAVCYPGLEFDTLYDYGPDPPRNAHWLAIFWETQI